MSQETHGEQPAGEVNQEYLDAFCDEFERRYPENQSSISYEGRGFLEGAKWTEKYYAADNARLRKELEEAKERYERDMHLEGVAQKQYAADLEQARKERDAIRKDKEVLQGRFDYVEQRNAIYIQALRQVYDMVPHDSKLGSTIRQAIGVSPFKQ